MSESLTPQITHDFVVPSRREMMKYPTVPGVTTRPLYWCMLSSSEGQWVLDTQDYGHPESGRLLLVVFPRNTLRLQPGLTPKWINDFLLKGLPALGYEYAPGNPTISQRPDSGAIVVAGIIQAIKHLDEVKVDGAGTGGDTFTSEDQEGIRRYVEATTEAVARGQGPLVEALARVLGELRDQGLDRDEKLNEAVAELRDILKATLEQTAAQQEEASKEIIQALRDLNKQIEALSAQEREEISETELEKKLLQLQLQIVGSRYGLIQEEINSLEGEEEGKRKELEERLKELNKEGREIYERLQAIQEADRK